MEPSWSVSLRLNILAVFGVVTKAPQQHLNSENNFKGEEVPAETNSLADPSIPRDEKELEQN